MNVFVAHGILGKDCEIRFTESGLAICEFSIANTIGYKDKKHTNWFNCTLFGKRAEGGITEYLKKGTKVMVTGELYIKTFEKKDGSKGFNHNLYVNDFKLLDSTLQNPQQSAQQPEAPVTTQPVPAAQTGFDDEMPF